MKVFIRVENDILTDVKYQIRGCPASIACASVMTELAIGKNIDDALLLNDMDIVNALDGLPELSYTVRY
jgi:nitrogen fixation NifU-like protein